MPGSSSASPGQRAPEPILPNVFALRRVGFRVRPVPGGRVSCREEVCARPRMAGQWRPGNIRNRYRRSPASTVSPEEGWLKSEIRTRRVGHSERRESRQRRDAERKRDTDADEQAGGRTSATCSRQATEPRHVIVVGVARRHGLSPLLRSRSTSSLVSACSQINRREMDRRWNRRPRSAMPDGLSTDQRAAKPAARSNAVRVGRCPRRARSRHSGSRAVNIRAHVGADPRVRGDLLHCGRVLLGDDRRGGGGGRGRREEGRSSARRGSCRAQVPSARLISQRASTRWRVRVACARVRGCLPMVSR
jgi:hypothetical protein